MLRGEIANALTSARPVLIATYREELSSRHYARRTIGSYERWLRRFLRFHRRRRPREMGGLEINSFGTNLGVVEQVNASAL